MWLNWYGNPDTQNAIMTQKWSRICFVNKAGSNNSFALGEPQYKLKYLYFLCYMYIEFKDTDQLPGKIYKHEMFVIIFV